MEESMRKNFEAWLDSDGDINFDMYAQDPSDWEWLVRHNPGLVVASAGGVVPFQAEGLIQGLPFYYRERHGIASLAVGEEDGEAFGNQVLYSSDMETEEFSEGKNFARNITHLLRELQPTLYLWCFSGKKLRFRNDGTWKYDVTEERDNIYGRGMTPEEGYIQTQQTSKYLLEKGCSAEKQSQMWKDRAISPTPLNKDERKWADLLPYVSRPSNIS